MGIVRCVPHVFRGCLHWTDLLGGLGWRQGMAYAMDSIRDNPDGPKHRGQRLPDRDCRNDNGGGGPTNARKRPDATLVLSVVAMGGLMLYVLIYKMDTTTALMLNGFFGVLIGRLSKGNGNQ